MVIYINTVLQQATIFWHRCRGLKKKKLPHQLHFPTSTTFSHVNYAPAPSLTTNTMRPVRRKPYQEHTFALRIPLELDDDHLVYLKLEHLS
jgi:hypothetical protein